jgi:hypothetical protein
MTTIRTTPATGGKCEFCGKPARWRSQQVDGDGKPLRVAVLACWRDRLAGRLLAEKTPEVAVGEAEATGQ